MLDNNGIVAASPKQTVFDREDLYNRVQGDEELMDEILELFVEDGQQQVERIKQAVGSGDAARVRSAAHALKGAASNVSAPTLAAVALALEQTARRGQLEDAVGLAAKLEEEFERFKQAVR